MKKKRDLLREWRRGMAVLLGIALIVAQLPFAVTEVQAETSHSHPVCGGDCVDDSNHENAAWTEWNIADAMPEAEGNYYLAKDVTLSATWKVSAGDTKLCLNGHSITYENAGTPGSVIKVPAGAALTITDCSATPGRITGGTGAHYEYRDGWFGGGYCGGGLVVEGTLNLYGGSIEENSLYPEDRDAGGGIFVDEGTFNMYGGTIQKNTADYFGGGVFCYGGRFSLYGGSICENGGRADDSGYIAEGGGVSLLEGTDMTMSGGTISKNKADHGAVSLLKKSKLTMSGDAVIADNVTRWVAGIRCSEESNFTMTGGSIHGNTGSSGGGVVVQTGAIMNMTGGSITSHKNGVGVKVCYFGHLNVSGGEITGNKDWGISVGYNDVHDDTVTLSGAPTIQGIELAEDRVIHIGGALTYTTPIPFAMSTAGQFTEGWSQYMDGKVASSFFDKGSSSLLIKKNQAKDGELYLVPEDTVHMHSGIPYGEILDSKANEKGIHEIIGTGLKSYYLTDDLLFDNLDNTLYIGDGTDKITVNLCLNGHKVEHNDSEMQYPGPVIIVRENATLNLYDCESSGVITGGTGRNAEKDGSIYSYGGGILVYGTLHMYGGSITNNTAGFGGGVYVTPGGAFHMHDGSISNNTAKTSGGGVTVAGEDAAVPVSEPILTPFEGTTGTIDEWKPSGSVNGDAELQTAAAGMRRAVRSAAPAALNLYGGSITGNTAATAGGVNARGKVTVETGTAITIRENTTADASGNSYSCNLYFPDPVPYFMMVNSIPANNSEIGVRMAVPDKFAETNSNMDENAAESFFKSDDTSYRVFAKKYEGLKLDNKYPVPEIFINYIDETLENFAVDGNYKINDIEVNHTDGMIKIDETWFGKKVSIVRLSGMGLNESKPQEFWISSRPDAPDNLTATPTTFAGEADGKIAGVSTDMQYKLSTAGNWTDCPETEITNLAAGQYQVRVKAGTYGSNSGWFAGEAASVTVKNGSPRTYTLGVTAPGFTAVTYGYGQPDAQSITIKSSGNTGTHINSVSLSGTAADKFVLNKTAGTDISTDSTDTTYTICPKAGLDAGSYEAIITVTYQNGESSTTTATDTVSFTVNAAGQTAPAAPEIASHRQSEITLNTVDPSTESGAKPEYSKDGGTTWQDGPVFTDLTNDTEYTFVVRYKANVNYNASSASLPLVSKIPHDFSSTVYDGHNANSHWHICNGQGCDATDTPVSHTGGEKTYFKQAKCTDCGAEYGGFATDTTKPQGEIVIQEDRWSSFWNSLTFGLFFKETQSVTITASDDSEQVDGYEADKHAVKIQYYCGSELLTLDKVKALPASDWENYDKSFKINPNHKYVVYAKITDHNGNTTYISTGELILDDTAPTVGGIEDGKTYCAAVTVEVSDPYGVTAEVDGVSVPITDDRFTINPKAGTQTVVIKDEADNTLTYTVTVNNGHTPLPDDGNCATAIHCSVCGAVTTEAKAHSFDNACDTDCNNADCAYTRTTTHVPNPDDGNCKTAVYCSICGAVTTEAKADHSFTNYTYNNDATYYKNGTKTATCDNDNCNQTDTREAAGTMLVDSKAPTGTITVNKDSFKAFISTITFGIFCNDKYDVTIEAMDAETEVQSIEYLLSKETISENDIASKDGWTEYEEFSLENEGEYIIYAKLTDIRGNISYLSSDGLVIDKTAPTVSGIEDGKTYCEAVTVTVSDAYGVTAEADGVSVPITDGRFTVNPKAGAQTIVIKDKAENTLTYTVTVNNGHTFTNYVSNNNAACTEDGTKTAKCEFCDEKNTVTDTGSKRGHDWNDTEYQWSADGKTCTAARMCKNDNAHIESVSINAEGKLTKAPTCTENGETTYTATFDVDWAETQTMMVADIAPNGHSYVHHDEIIATHKADGTAEHYTCENCDILFDKDKKEITKEASVLPMLDHEFGKEWKSNETQHWHECECGERSSVSDHTFEWVTDTEAQAGVAGTKHEECTVCGYAKAAVEISPLPVPEYSPVIDNTQSPQAGDNTNAQQWHALVFVSGSLLIGTTVIYKKRRKENR